MQVRPQSTWINGTSAVLAVAQLTIAPAGQLLGSAVFQGRQAVGTANISSQPAVFGHSSIYGQIGGGSGGGNAGPGTAGAMTLAGGAASTVSSIAVRQQTRNIQEQRRPNVTLISSPHAPSLYLLTHLFTCNLCMIPISISLQAPWQAGGPGGAGPWAVGGGGGASLRLIIGSALSLDGTIDVSGGSADVGSGAGGGAGGSLLIESPFGVFLGGGEVRAAGGHGGIHTRSIAHGGAGAGGAVAVRTCVDAFGGSFDAKGGLTMLPPHYQTYFANAVNPSDSFLAQMWSIDSMPFKQLLVAAAAGTIARRPGFFANGNNFSPAGLGVIPTSCVNAGADPTALSLSVTSWSDGALAQAWSTSDTGAHLIAMNQSRHCADGQQRGWTNMRGSAAVLASHSWTVDETLATVVSLTNSFTLRTAAAQPATLVLSQLAVGDGLAGITFTASGAGVLQVLQMGGSRGSRVTLSSGVTLLCPTGSLLLDQLSLESQPNSNIRPTSTSLIVRNGGALVFGPTLAQSLSAQRPLLSAANLCMQQTLLFTSLVTREPLVFGPVIVTLGKCAFNRRLY